MKDIKQHFKEFLEKEGVYEGFVRRANYMKYEDIFDRYNPQNYILSSFAIPYSELDKWIDISNKWRNHLKTIEK